MSIERHSDKTRSLQKSDESGISLIIVIKFVEPRIFQIGKREAAKNGKVGNQSAPFFSQVIQHPGRICVLARAM